MYLKFWPVGGARAYGLATCNFGQLKVLMALTYVPNFTTFYHSVLWAAIDFNGRRKKNNNNKYSCKQQWGVQAGMNAHIAIATRNGTRTGDACSKEWSLNKSNGRSTDWAKLQQSGWRLTMIRVWKGTLHSISTCVNQGSQGYVVCKFQGYGSKFVQMYLQLWLVAVARVYLLATCNSGKLNIQVSLSYVQNFITFYRTVLWAATDCGNGNNEETLENVWSLSSPYGFRSTSKQIKFTGISSLNSRDTKRSSWLMNWSHLWPAPGGIDVQKWANTDTNEETLENVWSLAPSSGKWRAETSREIKWDFPLFTGLTFGLTVTKR